MSRWAPRRLQRICWPLVMCRSINPVDHRFNDRRGDALAPAVVRRVVDHATALAAKNACSAQRAASSCVGGLLWAGGRKGRSVGPKSSSRFSSAFGGPAARLQISPLTGALGSSRAVLRAVGCQTGLAAPEPTDAVMALRERIRGAVERDRPKNRGGSAAQRGDRCA